MQIGATSLTTEQIWGFKALDVIKRYDTAVGATDLAIAQGAVMTSDYRTSDGLRACGSWTTSAGRYGGVRVVNYHGYGEITFPNGRDRAARPALPPSMTSAIAAKYPVVNGRVQYGEYPQRIADDVAARRLKSDHMFGQLQKTGKKYTFDGTPNDHYGISFLPIDYPEYIMDGRRFIRVMAVPYDGNSILSNGKRLKDGDICWIEVKPIIWLVDKTGWWVAHQALFAGMQFDNKKSYDGDFNRTAMKRYYDYYFVPQMTQSYAFWSNNTVNDVITDKLVNTR